MKKSSARYPRKFITSKCCKGWCDIGSIQFWKIYHLWENVKGKNPVRSLTMNQEKQERIKACLQELSTLLY
ncbi:hypothetical protein, partial [Nostoc sp. DedVER01b]|uniref:hypothetical protein n=1 Tax=Nostoc sp. DedVER01b TaxID=3075404 RepID=UPI002AD562F4